MTLRTRQILPCVVALSVAFSACGADDSKDPPAEPPTTAPPPTSVQPQTETEPQESEGQPQSGEFPPDFVRKVDALCKKAEEDLNELQRAEGVRDPDTLHDVAVLFEEFSTDLEQQDPPAENAAAWERYTELWRRGADTVGTLEAEAADGDKAAFQKATDALEDIDKRSRELSRQYGFEECASG